MSKIRTNEPKIEPKNNKDTEAQPILSGSFLKKVYLVPSLFPFMFLFHSFFIIAAIRKMSRKSTVRIKESRYDLCQILLIGET